MNDEDAGPYTTISIPIQLIVESRRSPMDIALYGLIGRLFIKDFTEVPLTRHDVLMYDPTFTHGRFQRGITRLQKYSWVITNTSNSRTNKYTYIPTWGVTPTTVIRWNQGTKLRQCPRHVAHIDIDISLFDHFCGVLIPSRTKRAHVIPGNPQQSLTLRDIGIYISALAKLPVSSPRLEEVGLLKDGVPQPLSSVGISSSITPPRE